MTDSANGTVVKIPLRVAIVIAPLAITAVLAWSWVREAPEKYEKLTERVSKNDTNIILIQAELRYIREGIVDIKDMLHTKRSHP